MLPEAIAIVCSPKHNEYDTLKPSTPSIVLIGPQGFSMESVLSLTAE